MTSKEQEYLSANLNSVDPIKTCLNHIKFIRKRINEPQSKFELEMALLGYSDWLHELEILQKEIR